MKILRYPLPKLHTTIFLDLPTGIEDNSPFESKQINVYIGNKYNYWFIQPSEFPLKLEGHKIPQEIERYYRIDNVTKLIRLSLENDKKMRKLSKKQFKG